MADKVDQVFAMDLWTEVATIPGLAVHNRGDGCIEYVISNGHHDSYIVGEQSQAEWHRYVALYVVDELERQGVAFFSRNGSAPSYPWSVRVRRYDGSWTDSYTPYHSGPQLEHVCLLECLAHVVHLLRKRVAVAHPLSQEENRG